MNRQSNRNENVGLSLAGVGCLAVFAVILQAAFYLGLLAGVFWLIRHFFL